MYTYRAKVVRILDGDTIECDIDLGFHITTRRIVRLSGIDVPHQFSKDEQESIKAKKAQELLQSRLNSSVILKTELGKKEKFGRVLAFVFESENDLNTNQSLNLKLIQEGFAVKYDGGKKNV